MLEEKTSFREKVSQVVQKAKGYPKILLSLLALFSVGIGFLAGRASSSQGPEGPHLRVGTGPKFIRYLVRKRRMLHRAPVKEVKPRIPLDSSIGICELS